MVLVKKFLLGVVPSGSNEKGSKDWYKVCARIREYSFWRRRKKSTHQTIYLWKFGNFLWANRYIMCLSRSEMEQSKLIHITNKNQSDPVKWNTSKTKQNKCKQPAIPCKVQSSLLFFLFFFFFCFLFFVCFCFVCLFVCLFVCFVLFRWHDFVKVRFYVLFSFLSKGYKHIWGSRISQWLERRTRDRKVAGSNLGRSGRRFFSLQVQHCADSYFVSVPLPCYRSST